MIAQLLPQHLRIIFNAWNSESKMNHWRWQAVIFAAGFYISFWTYGVKFFIISVLVIQHQLLGATSDARSLGEGHLSKAVTTNQQLDILTCRWLTALSTGYQVLCLCSSTPSAHLPLSSLPTPGYGVLIYACFLHFTEWHWSTHKPQQKEVLTHPMPFGATWKDKIGLGLIRLVKAWLKDVR